MLMLWFQGVMCLSCGRFWTALQILWSIVYVTCGGGQVLAGIFFTISLPELYLYGVIFAGAWVSANLFCLFKIYVNFRKVD